MSKFFILAASCLLATSVYALPDDANREVNIVGGSGEGEIDLNRDLWTLRGSPDEPIIITQGSLKITGLEVSFERVNGAVHMVSVKGEPATLQQQPEVDKGIIYASALEITFNNTEQIVILEQEAELIQEGKSVNTCYIDYQLISGNVSFNTCNNGERLEVIIPPGQDQ